MHIQSYYDLENGLQAFEVAYLDVKNAFMFYWENFNKGNKFIIAGHSQGTNHTERLLKDIILENDSMRNRLLISYLPGMPIKQFHKDLAPCSSPNQLGLLSFLANISRRVFPKRLGSF